MHSLDKKKRVCGTCMHWEEIYYEERLGRSGWCNRFPPVLWDEFEESYPSFILPETGVYHHCGEWRKKRKDKSKKRLKDKEK